MSGIITLNVSLSRLNREGYFEKTYVILNCYATL